MTVIFELTFIGNLTKCAFELIYEYLKANVSNQIKREIHNQE